MMNKKFFIRLTLLTAVCVMTFSSCQLVDKYKAPKVDAKYLFRDRSCTDTITIANQPWKQYFKDPFLRNLISEGLDNNLDLQIATYRIREAETQLNIAKGAYFPDVALVGKVQQNRYSSQATSSKNRVLGYPSTTYSLGIAVSWEADIWGKINRQQRAAWAQFKQSESYRNLIQTSLISNIATSYYALLALDEQLRITNQTIILLGENTQTMQALMDAGMPNLNRAAVNQSKGLLYNTKTTVPDLEYQIKQLENSLCVLLGRKPGVIARTTLQKQAIPSELKCGVPVQMLAKRPDVQQSELQFRTAFELTNVARASLYPSVTLGTGSLIGFGASSLANFFTPQNILANILGGFTQPIFNRYKLIGQLKIAKAQQAEALLSFKNTVLQASSEVSNIMYRFETSLRKNNDRIEQITALSTAVDDTKMLLEEGNANYTEVLSAEQSLLKAQLTQIQDKLEQLQASVDLYRALGGGTK